MQFLPLAPMIVWWGSVKDDVDLEAIQPHGQYDHGEVIQNDQPQEWII